MSQLQMRIVALWNLHERSFDYEQFVHEGLTEWRVDGELYEIPAREVVEIIDSLLFGDLRWAYAPDPARIRQFSHEAAVITA